MFNFDKIYKDYYKRSLGFVKSYVFEDMAAEDIVSESLVSLWQTMRKENVQHPLSLLLTILRNNSLNYLKAQGRQLDGKDAMSAMIMRDINYRINCMEACDPQEIFSSEITTIIEETLNSLSEQTRRIFELSRYEQYSIKEIAEKLNISPKTVEYHISKSLKALRLSLKDYLPLFYFLFA